MNMISYGEAKARAKTFKADWNEEEYTARAIITWCDGEKEYEFEVENEDEFSDEEFAEWIEKNAEEFAKEDADEKGKTFEEVTYISYETEIYDDDEDFDRSYEDWCDLQGDSMREDF